MKDRKEYLHQWYLANKERKAEKEKNRYLKNKEKFSDYQIQYRKTPIGRASRLLGNYNATDKAHGRGKGDLTASWILENILSQPCAHCGKTGWDIIGCNRLDNSKPHTMDNVEPCCFECNKKLYYSRNK